MAKPRGLGRGFDSLIPTEVTADMPAALAPTAPTGDSVRQLAPAAIQANPYQPRTQFDATELEGLADSIRQHGILQPLVVSDLGNGRYELIAGERRLRAARLAGLTTVPAIIRSFDEQQKLELALLENLQRAALNPLETAAAYRKLMDEFNLSLDDVAARMGKAKSTVANTIRLLALPKAALEAVGNGIISEAHGRAILAVADDATVQEELLHRIITGGWTVRQAEAFARDHKTEVSTAPGSSSQPLRPLTTPAHTQLAEQLGTYLQTPVSLQSTAKGGRLVIKYASDEELLRVVKAIKHNVTDS